MSAMKERLTEAAELLGMDPADLLNLLDTETEMLPAPARTVADHVINELWLAVDNGQVEDETGYAADVVRRLHAAYGVTPVSALTGKPCPRCGTDLLTAARAFAAGEESERFAGFDDTEPDREPSPEQERAWDVREDEARGSAL